MNNKNNNAFSLIELSIVVLIIGILIAGVMQANKIVYKFRVSTAQTLTPSSPVPSIKNLVLWLDATSKNSFLDSETEDGSAITMWYDLNPSAINKNNARAIVSPTYIKDCINSLPCLKFAQSGNYVETTLSIGRTTEITIFAVFSVNGEQQDDYGDIVVTKDYSGSGKIWYYSYSSSSSGSESLNYEGPVDSSEIPIERLKPQIATLVNSNTKHKQYINGNILEDKSAGSIAAASSIPNILQIGAWNANSDSDPGDYSEYFNGSIGEIIIFNRGLKDEERKSVEKYLGQKWGIKVSQ